MELPKIHVTVDPIPFDSTEAELEAGKLTGSNIQKIKNLIGECLNDLISLNTDSISNQEYMLRVARIRGEISAYSHLINLHISAHSQTNPTQE